MSDFLNEGIVALDCYFRMEKILIKPHFYERPPQKNRR